MDILNKIDNITESFRESCEKSLCECCEVYLESVKHSPECIKSLECLKALLGDRLFAYALACDDLTQIKERIGFRQMIIASHLVKFLDSLQNKQAQVIDELILIAHVNCARSFIIGTILPDTQTPAEQLICQIAREIFPQRLLPRKNKSEKYAQVKIDDIWYSLDDIMQESEQYTKLLLLLTQDSFKLRNVFPNMKSEAEYRELAKAAKVKGMPVKDIFNDLSVFHVMRCYFSQIPYNLISNVTYNFTNNINQDALNFIHSALQEFRSFISLVADNKIKVTNIHGLNIYINGIKTIDTIQIRPIAESDKQCLSADMVTSCGGSSVLAVYEQEEEFSLDLILKKSDNANIALLLDQHIKFMKLAVAITLAYSDYIISRPNFNFSKYNFIAIQDIFLFSKYPLFASISVKYGTNKCGSVAINNEVISQASIYLNQLNSLSDNVIYSLIIPMHRLLSTKQDILFGGIDSIIDAVIVWESLLGSKEEELATAIHLMGIEEKGEVKRLYKIRCQIVHGNQTIGILKLGKRESLSNLKYESLLAMSDDFKKIIKIALDLFKYVIGDVELNQMSSPENRAKYILGKMPFGYITKGES